MKRASFLILITMLLSALVYAQAPLAPPAASAPAAAQPAATNQAPAAAAAKGPAVVPTGGSKFAVIDFMTALTETKEGKVVSEKLNAESAKRQTTFQAKQKEGADIQAKLTNDKTLTDAQKASMSRQIDVISTELTRMSDDFQKEMQTMQQDLLSPIADKVKKELSAYATENSFALVMDTSGQTDNIIYVSPVADITTEIIRRVDAAAAKAPATSAPPASRPSTTTPSRPAGTAPGATTTPPSRPPVAPPTKAPPELN